MKMIDPLQENFCGKDPLVKDRIKDKILKKRSEHSAIKGLGEPKIPKETVPTIPGVMTSRGCAFAGARGVVFGPITDVANIVHGPIGCSYYTWDQRRNLGTDSHFLKLCFSTDLKEKDIIFGGEKKLYSTIIQVGERFHPAAVAVYATCPVGLIGDDIDAVCRKAQEKLGVPVIPVHSEGFKGVNQSDGHKIACDTIAKYITGTVEPDTVTDYDVNIVGEYNIGGEGWEFKRLFKKLGLRVYAVWTGDSKYKELASCHRVKLNLIHCQRSITSLAEDMMANYGIPIMNISMFGIEQSTDSLRRIAAFFGLEANAEKLIAEEFGAIKKELEYYRSIFKDKRIAMYIGGARSWHFVKMFADLGLNVVSTGSEFGHGDDYEKMWLRAKEGTKFIDDMNHYELHELVTKYKPDIVASGIKEMFTARSRGVPYLNIHSYTGAGPFIGFRGLINLAKELEKAMAIEDPSINVPCWETEGVK
jgi:nitrogenase molybdenum-iron protein alpha chain